VTVKATWVRLLQLPYRRAFNVHILKQATQSAISCPCCRISTPMVAFAWKLL